jgi:DNA-binding MarR family transcriptional regulator
LFVDFTVFWEIVFSSLLIIGENEGISLVELSKIQFIKKSIIGKIVQKLEAKKYIIKKINKKDRREQNLFLTKLEKKQHLDY